MNYETAITVLSGILQCLVAGYGFFLARRFSVSRVGWPLVFTFSLLALLRGFLGRTDFDGGTKMNMMFGVVSLLILSALIQLHLLLRERQEAELKREQTQQELQASVERKTAELTQVNQELQTTAECLKAEVAERALMQERAEKSHREMLIVSRQAGMSDVATSVLHNVGNVLNSLNVSATMVANHLEALKIERVVQVARLLKLNAGKLGPFFSVDAKGKHIVAFMQQLGEHLSKEQDLLLKEVDFIRAKVDHIKVIVSTQQSYGKVSGVTEKVRVTDLVEDLLRIHAADLEDHGITIIRNYEPSLPEIPVDKHKVLQILLNLTTNAKHSCVDSGRENRQVTVRVTNGDDRVRIAVGDNGVGISPENIKKIFSHGFTTRKNSGHGFGLHSGALIARDMGGALTAQSDGTGRGAVFTLELPVRPRSQTYAN